MSETLAAPAHFEQSIQKSRFLARAWPVLEIADALAQVAECASEAASHHCWAYRIGQEYRFHDADEPAGTAGRPILQAIDSQGLDRTLVVVTRWFGGIKLGAGGLVRAYGGSAAECLRLAPRRVIVALARLGVSVPFASESALRALIEQLAGSISGERYDSEGLHCEVELPRSSVPGFGPRLRDLCRGRSTLRAID